MGKALQAYISEVGNSVGPTGPNGKQCLQYISYGD